LTNNWLGYILGDFARNSFGHPVSKMADRLKGHLSLALTELRQIKSEMNDFYGRGQGCQMVCFQTKNPNLGKFGRALDWKMFIYFMAFLE
jgi:hypothetical protein